MKTVLEDFVHPQTVVNVMFISVGEGNFFEVVERAKCVCHARTCPRLREKKPGKNLVAPEINTTFAVYPTDYSGVA